MVREHRSAEKRHLQPGLINSKRSLTAYFVNFRATQE